MRRSPGIDYRELIELDGLCVGNIPQFYLLQLHDGFTIKECLDKKTKEEGGANREQLTKLRTVHIPNTKVTATGVKKLQSALPKCTILR